MECEHAEPLSFLKLTGEIVDAVLSADLYSATDAEDRTQIRKRFGQLYLDSARARSKVSVATEMLTGRHLEKMSKDDPAYMLTLRVYENLWLLLCEGLLVGWNGRGAVEQEAKLAAMCRKTEDWPGWENIYL